MPPSLVAGYEEAGIERLHDFDRVGFPDEFFSEIVCGETRRALAAADGDTDNTNVGGRDARRNVDPGEDFYFYFTSILIQRNGDL